MLRGWNGLQRSSSPDHPAIGRVPPEQVAQSLIQPGVEHVFKAK